MSYSSNSEIRDLSVKQMRGFIIFSSVMLEKETLNPCHRKFGTVTSFGCSFCFPITTFSLTIFYFFYLLQIFHIHLPIYSILFSNPRLCLFLCHKRIFPGCFAWQSLIISLFLTLFDLWHGFFMLYSPKWCKDIFGKRRLFCVKSLSSLCLTHRQMVNKKLGTWKHSNIW